MLTVLQGVLAPHVHRALSERCRAASCLAVHTLRRRCVKQVLTGKARYSFTHAIAKADLEEERRVSITFRQSPVTAKA